MANPALTRRIVSGHDTRGNSIFISDGPAPNVNIFENGGGMGVTESWSTVRTPTGNQGNKSAGEINFVLELSPGGTKFRVVEYPPDKLRFARSGDARTTRETRGGADVATDSTRHPGMHKTASLDYAIVLCGEIHAVMDQGETLMRTGDVLIQRGTSHAWSNRTDQPARVAFVLIGAEPL